MNETTPGTVVTVCAGCGRPTGDLLAGDSADCTICADLYLRAIDADFLDDYARFGARSRQVVAEACLRALVLSDVDDRKLLAMTVYEQFVAAATDFIGLYHALRNRSAEPIVKGMLGFQLEPSLVTDFFARLLNGGPTELLRTLGLPHAEQLAAPGWGLDARERKQVRRALGEALADLERLGAFRTVGERALVNAARQLGGPKTLTDRAGWLSGPHPAQGQVAALALSRERRRMEVNVLNTDEDTLGAVVDGIDIMTRLTRNLIFSFVSLHSSSQFRGGFGQG